MAAVDKFSVLLLNKDELESALADVDVQKLSADLRRYGLLPMKTSSLDHDRLDQQIIVRYLLQVMYERVKEKEIAFDSLINAFSSLGGRASQVCVAIIEELAGGDKRGSGRLCEIQLDERHIQCVHEKLIPYSHRWVEISRALGLPSIVIKACSGNSNAERLLEILGAWIAGGFSGAKSATLDRLKLALSSNILNLPAVAEDLEKSILVPPISIPAYPIELASCSDDTEVDWKKSTLIEVRVCGAASVESTSYQWSKDGETLVDGDEYSGSTTSILYIDQANQSATYTCSVTCGSQTLQSKNIALVVVYPPEMKLIMHRYSKVRDVPRDS